MSMTGTFSGPPAPIGGSASANSYDTIQELLYKLPDNSANSIQAKDVRDAVYSLWEKIDYLGTASGATSSVYTNTNKVPINVGGVVRGSTFNNKNMTEMWNTLLYPYVGPSASISIIGDTVVEKGQGSSGPGSAYIVSLSWNVLVGSQPVTSIKLIGNNLTGGPWNSDVSGVTTSIIPVQLSYSSNVFSLVVSDGIQTYTSSTILYWKNKVFWGSLPSTHQLGAVSSLSIYNNTGQGGSNVNNVINNLSNKLSDNYSQGNNYISDDISTDLTNSIVVLMWPVNNSLNLINKPHVKINGMINNDWTKVRNSITYYNQWNHGEYYDVWRFNYTQSTINTFNYNVT